MYRMMIRTSGLISDEGFVFVTLLLILDASFSSREAINWSAFSKASSWQDTSLDFNPLTTSSVTK